MASSRLPNIPAVYWHLLGWFFYGGYNLLGLVIGRNSPTSKAVWFNGSMLFIRILEFYLCYRVVYPRLLRPGRGWSLAGALLGVVALFIGLRALIEEVIFPAVLGFRNYTPDTKVWYYVLDNMYFAVPMIVISAALWAGRATLLQERENRVLRGEKRAAEVAFLKTQINPHFLYNTLNMLYSMAYPVAKPLAAAILQLADLMRYMLRDTPDGQVLLTEEIDYLRNYLDLYRLRFADQFFVDFQLAGDPAGHRIAPLLLIPFVENALKHGTLDDPAHPVRINLALSPGEVRFEVRNQPLDPTDHKDATTGVGLPNLRRRLALLYPGRHTLRVETGEQEQFVTSLQLAG
ncbi:sensor histidine kinase [Hymenobacter rubripertinctus]|uniref:Sensor histidine kinase n=1 Tax=Hymenobacter rubripertinctus TaxID=2029981 RepID=A0A418R1R4_9BACT|nr:sensor histidine kinase [Hymenobacter rubripertinctus]RIY11366.1 sensor histidine kinase [Hymenobacter rubripertinctus]